MNLIIHPPSRLGQARESVRWAVERLRRYRHVVKTLPSPANATMDRIHLAELESRVCLAWERYRSAQGVSHA